jgi:hypothetical protein
MIVAKERMWFFETNQYSLIMSKTINQVLTQSLKPDYEMN